MPKIKFNKSNIENLKPTEIRYKVYTDECRGLYVEVYPSGHKTYRVRYKINQRSFHYQIGVYPEITPMFAVKRGGEIKTLVAQGKSPQQDKLEKRREYTFKEWFIERFLQIQLDNRESKEKFYIDNGKEENGEEKSNKDKGRVRWRVAVGKSIYNISEQYNAHLRFSNFANKKMSDITIEDIQSFLRTIEGKHTHNRLLRELNHIFNTFNVNANPVKQGLKTILRFKQVDERKVQASLKDIQAIGNALLKVRKGYMQENGYYYQPQVQQSNIIEILFYEGLRPIEVMGMKWSEINDDWVYTTKTKSKTRTIPLTPQTQRVLLSIEKVSDYVFPSRTTNSHIKDIGKVWKKVIELSGITKDLRLYDLRSTFSSTASKRFGIWESSKMTNHDKIETTNKHYSHLEEVERREKKTVIAEGFSNLLYGTGGTVVPIKEAKGEDSN